MYIDILNHEDYKQYNLSSIRSGIVAGAPCPVTLCERLVNELRMHDLQVYLIELNIYVFFNFTIRFVMEQQRHHQLHLCQFETIHHKSASAMLGT